MTSRDVGPAFEAFTTAAAAVAERRPEVDPDTARELLQEAAVMLHNGLAFDGLDDHDTEALVARLADDLTARDPTTAVRARAASVLDEPDGLHDPAAVAAACLDVVRILRL